MPKRSWYLLWLLSISKNSEVHVNYYLWVFRQTQVLICEILWCDFIICKDKVNVCLVTASILRINGHNV